MKREMLIEVFGKRPTRMKLLENSLDQIALDARSRILETGCSFGDGIAFACEKTSASGYGVDMEESYITEAKIRHPNISFKVASVYDLGYNNGMFGLVFSQAAFSLLKDKLRAIAEYHRVLQGGGYVIINDFVVKMPVTSNVRDDIDFIPCFNSIGTIGEYKALFEQSGFDTVLAMDRYSEIVSTTIFLSKNYHCTPEEMAALFASILGNDDDAAEKSRCFFKSARVSYAQLIFKKSDLYGTSAEKN